MDNNKMLTIVDIAQLAGVSKTTVSRFLNGKYEYMSKDTRTRIAKVIEVSGYRPNKMAQSLKSQKSMLIGLVVADIESPFTAAVTKNIGDALQKSQYNLMVANSDNNYKLEQKFIHSMISQRVDGLIVNTAQMDNPNLIRLANEGYPIVLLDRLVKDYKFDIAYLENEQSINMAVDHLIEMGYGCFSFFSQPDEKIAPRLLRKQAFLQRLSSMGEMEPNKFAFTNNQEQKDFINSLTKIMAIGKERGVTPGIICTNGVTLIRTIKAVRSLGLSMPNDIGVCGFDDWGWSSELGWANMIDVGITTLQSPIHKLGDATAELLLERLKNPKAAKKEVAIPIKLVVDESTRKS